MRGNAVRKQVFVYAVLALALAVAGISWYVYTQRNVEHLLDTETRVNVLMVARDDDPVPPVMALVSFTERDVAIVPIPADLLVRDSSGRFHQAAGLLRTAGTDAVCEAVSSLLGMEIPFYVTCELDQVVSWVDALDGVRVTLDERAVYRDLSAEGAVRVDIRPGVTLLRGNEARSFAVSPSEDGDVGILKRQGVLIRTLFAQGIAEEETIRSLTSLFRRALPNLETRMSALALAQAADLLRRVAVEDMAVHLLSGVSVEIDGTTYTQLRVMETARFITSMIRGIELVTPGDVRVAVFNGNGIRGSASGVGSYLEDRGFRVTSIGNADHFGYVTSHVMVLSEEPKAWVVRDALPGETTVGFPETLASAYQAVRNQVPAGTDVVLIVGLGLEVE